MKIIADINKVSAIEWGTNSGEFNARKVAVELSEEYSECDRVLVRFTKENGMTFDSLVDNGYCRPPYFPEPTRCVIGVYGEKAEDGELIMRISPQPMRAVVKFGTYTDTEPENPPIPTRGDYERLLEVIDSKQDELVSGENIKTIDGQSILGAGNIETKVEERAQIVRSFDDGVLAVSGTNVYFLDEDSLAEDASFENTCKYIYEHQGDDGLVVVKRNGKTYLAKTEAGELGLTITYDFYDSADSGVAKTRVIVWDAQAAEDALSFSDIDNYAFEADWYSEEAAYKPATVEAVQARLNEKQDYIEDLDEIRENAALASVIDTYIMEGTDDENVLVNRDFVNSSVSTNTAYYISNGGEPFASFEQLIQYSQEHSSELTNNDYAFVVGEDSVGNVTYTRYKYSSQSRTWSKEYVLNNSSFTSTQWAAIESGITANLVSRINMGLNDIPNKMDKANPTGTGSFSINRKSGTTVGYQSTAEGGEGTASGSYSHAEGLQSAASGYAAHAEGYRTDANDLASHAEGYQTKSHGYASHAEGGNTEAVGDYSHAEGVYNIPDVTMAHIVGNGTSGTSKSNAHTLDWDGNAWFAGDVYVGSMNGTNKDVGSKKLATEEYVDTHGSVQTAIIGETEPTFTTEGENGQIYLHVRNNGPSMSLINAYVCYKYFTTSGWRYIWSNITARDVSDRVSEIEGIIDEDYYAYWEEYDSSVSARVHELETNAVLKINYIPTSTTFGRVGDVRICSLNGLIYKCASTSGGSYSWVVISGGVEEYYDISAGDWSEKASIDYGGRSHYTQIQTTYDITENTEVTLLNTNQEMFDKYCFAITGVDAANNTLTVERLSDGAAMTSIRLEVLYNE